MSSLAVSFFVCRQERATMPSGKENKFTFITPVNNDGKSPRMFAIPQKSKSDRFFDSGAQFMIAVNLLGWIGWLIYPSKEYIIFWSIFSLINIFAIVRIMQMIDGYEKILKEMISSDKDAVDRMNQTMERYRNETTPPPSNSAITDVWEYAKQFSHTKDGKDWNEWIGWGGEQYRIFKETGKLPNSLSELQSCLYQCYERDQISGDFHDGDVRQEFPRAIVKKIRDTQSKLKSTGETNV